ncbi:MAG TPA: protein-tyrosine phosphatase family protein [Anaerolineales bacterium]|nr:protein-tyrosine phosphatase family protein [Anaerolineales bacterium]
MPFARFDKEYTALDEMIQAGVSTVVMLIEEGEDFVRAARDLKTIYTENNLAVIHYPIIDFDTPDDPGELQSVIAEVSEKVREGERVAVHCFAGQGRTGMFIALLGRQLLGLGGDEAIEWVRGYFRAIETVEQEQVVRDYQPGE